jgi:hypothetical protein
MANVLPLDDALEISALRTHQPKGVSSPFGIHE